MPEDTKVIIKRVEKYGPKPRSARQVLTQAHALLLEEGQWAAGHFFRDGDAEEAYEASTCGSWTACAMGALGLVSGEMPVTVTKEWEEVSDDDLLFDWKYEVGRDETTLSFDQWAEDKDRELEVSFSWNTDGDDPDFDETTTPLSWKAAQFLAAAILKEQDDALDDRAIEEPMDVVISFNDRDANGRTRVLEAFEKAIKLAARGKLKAPVGKRFPRRVVDE